ncbi:MAG: antibiotic biosynthesis monooxygenase [Pseudomonadota bacterium]
MIGLTAHMFVADGKQGEFESMMKDLRVKVKANEPGALLYDLFKVKGSETDYVVMEQYVDAAALAAHGKTDYFLEASPKLGACFTKQPEINMFESVE